jgi:uncharacterized protein (TIGR03083 family)
MSALARRVRLALRESERQRTYVNTLPPEAFDHPTACSRWVVRDLLAHLVMATGFQTSMMRRGLQGDPSPPEGLPVAGALRAPAVTDLVHHLTIATQQQVGDQLFPAFHAAYEEIDQFLARLDVADGEKLCYHPGALVPVSGFVDLRLMELYVHGWDLRSRLEPPAHLPPESWPVLFDLLPHFLGYMVVPAAQEAAERRYRFALTERGATACDLVVAGGTLRLEAAGLTPAQVTVACDPETFLLLMWGRLAWETAVADGHISIAGDHRLAADFGRWYRGF